MKTRLANNKIESKNMNSKCKHQIKHKSKQINRKIKIIEDIKYKNK